MNKKSNLDERQEQILLTIEHNGFWMAFWGLLIAMTVQMIVYGMDFGRIAGEWIVFMVIALYVSGKCEKNGIWDRRLQPNAKTNLLLSLVSALGFGAVIFAVLFRNYSDSPAGAAIAAGITAAGVFILVYATLTLVARSVKKVQQKQEEEQNEEE